MDLLNKLNAFIEEVEQELPRAEMNYQDKPKDTFARADAHSRFKTLEKLWTDLQRAKRSLNGE